MDWPESHIGHGSSFMCGHLTFTGHQFLKYRAVKTGIVRYAVFMGYAVQISCGKLLNSYLHYWQDDELFNMSEIQYCH